MPMIDAYIPAGALDDDAERSLFEHVTDMVVRHEIRRTLDVVDDPATVEASISRAKSIAWLFVHRTETYVAGSPSAMPYYKFHVRVPESQNDDVFRKASVEDITAAVADAEGGKWPHPEFRVWVFTSEIPDGTWGAVGQITHLGDILSFVLGQDVRAEGAQRVVDWHADKAVRVVAASGLAQTTGS